MVDAVAVLGKGAGGEAGNSQQCSVFVEEGKLYAFYITGTVAVVSLAVADLPTDPDAAPVFAKLGTVWTDTFGATTGSVWVMKAKGLYWMFAERGSSLRLATSTAETMAGLVATPFATVVPRITPGLAVDLGSRDGGCTGRPSVYHEDGTWIMYTHMITSIDQATGQIRRFTATTPTIR